MEIEPGTAIYRVYVRCGRFGVVGPHDLETVTFVKETPKMIFVREWSFFADELRDRQHRKADPDHEFFASFEEARDRLLAIARPALDEMKRTLDGAELQLAEARREYEDRLARFRGLERDIPQAEEHLRTIAAMAPPKPPEKQRPRRRGPRYIPPLPK